MCSIMMQCSSSSSIPMSKVKTSGNYVVSRFNEYAKELHRGTILFYCMEITR